MNIDFTSPAWQHIVAYAEQEMADCRKKNDGDLTELQTAKLRGEIACWKKLLGLPRIAVARSMGVGPG